MRLKWRFAHVKSDEAVSESANGGPTNPQIKRNPVIQPGAENGMDYCLKVFYFSQLSYMIKNLF